MANAGVSSFLWLSDLHFDPFYGQPEAASFQTNVCSQGSSNESYPYGRTMCDAPKALIDEALHQAHLSLEEKDHDIDFILISGDLCRHANEVLDHPLSSTQSILTSAVEAVQSVFPGVHVIITVGNNDFTPDYFIDDSYAVNNTLLNMVTDAFQNIFINPEEELQFRSGAYLARNVTDKLTVLALNTIMYSVRHMPNQSYVEDPLGQFEWLKNQLQKAKLAGRRVLITGHIPPSMGSYHRSQLWNEEYLVSYYDIIQEYFPDVIAGHLFGHVHTDEFRFVSPKFSTSKDQSYPIFMAGSITPIYGSNPSFRFVRYEEETGDLLDYDTFYIDLNKTGSEAPTWIHPPSFTQDYNVPDMSKESIEFILQEMFDERPNNKSSALWNVFFSRRYVYASSDDHCDDADEVCRKEWSCIITSLTRKGFESCFRAPFEPKMYPPLVFVGVLVTLAIIIGFFLVMKRTRCLKRRHYQSNLQNTHNHIEISANSNCATGIHNTEDDEIENLPQIT
jgi:3',5'-cyclic AMP phosphodiesterase CpdA